MTYKDKFPTLHPKRATFLSLGMDAFVDGGLATGKHVNGNLLLAAADRVAIDAVGVAALKSLGSNQTIMHTKIFDHEQIARAAGIGVGVSCIDDIEIIAPNEESRVTSDRVLSHLK